MPKEQKYLYGPVPSRRLGRSLGIDIVPLKACTLDCIYCQLGANPRKTTHRRQYVRIDAVLTELAQRMAEGLDADYITIAGSGEPTLNSGLAELIKGIKKITDIPVAIVTNGTLLHRPDVRADCAAADVVMPSLDAGDEPTFRKINRPHADISLEKLISGLCALRAEFSGQIWLEVFLVEDVNTDFEQIEKIKTLIERIRPDKIHLNTAVRPTAEAEVTKVGADRLAEIAAHLGPTCEIIADFKHDRHLGPTKTTAQDVLSMLKRRPCSLADVCAGLGLPRDEAAAHLDALENAGLVQSYQQNDRAFFKAVP